MKTVTVTWLTFFRTFISMSHHLKVSNLFMWMVLKKESVCAGIVDKHISFQYNGTTASNVDQVYEYSRQLLSVGCFYLEFADAIREGDGDRVHQCWKYLLPLFKGSNRTNYSIEALTFLNRCEFKLTPRQSEELKWSRFINCHGIRGRNIPCGLHLEHMNRLCKDAVHGLQANKTAVSVVRVGKSLGRLSEIVEMYDDGNDIQAPSGSHRIPAANKDRDLILRELLILPVTYFLLVHRDVMPHFHVLEYG
ncbi:uncharacterized protein [Dysidea avara]|uniref:uncharacterized protein n=1 Tax=Dysidea avara TaxID=196820 RepID=UPI003321B6F0